MEEFRYLANDLWCEEVKVGDIAGMFGTPLYVYSRRSVIDHCRHVERAFGQVGHVSCYAVKANANPELLRTLAAEGIGADAGSMGELRAVLEAGFPPSKITFSGVGKGDDEIGFALANRIRSINVESLEELEVVSGIAARMGVDAGVLLRVNFDIPSSTHPYITTGRRQNKFGIPVTEAHGLFRHAMALPGIRVTGVHSHIGSQIIDPETFVAAARTIAGFVSDLRREGIPVTELNFGGGFGVQYRNYVSHPLLPAEPENPEEHLSTVSYIQAILPILKESGCTIVIQPGRSIVAHAGILVTRVLYRKESGGKIFIIVDGGMNDLIRPSLYEAYHQIVPVALREVPHETADVVGPLCESGDFFAQDRMMTRCERGEYLAVMCTGAYGYVLSSNYNGRPQPAEVLVSGASCSVIRERREMNQ